ncbi:hypothetical protein SteCoe_24156 [Stentor coeruleus]|uniref:Uncharacterized protein n=1 Tax=Stentor coeruleus TaxID=5963 RepID=A0A1R2BI75_9CILI|nr:hypothetical protein SteCoe_24156 [Stentor coeruleus]
MPMNRAASDRFTARTLRDPEIKLLEEQQSMFKDNKRPITVSPIYPSSNNSDILETRRNVKETILKLNIKEKNLLEKEKLLFSQQKEFKSVLKSFSEQKKMFDLQKDELVKTQDNYRRNYQELERNQLALKKLEEDFKEEKSKFDKQRSEIYNTKMNTEFLSKQSEKNLQSTAMQGKRNFEELGEIGEVNSRLEEQLEQDTEMGERLLELQAKIKSEQKKLKKLLAKNENDKKILTALKDNIKEEREGLKADLDQMENLKISIENKAKSLTLLTNMPQNIEHNSLDFLYKRLQNQIEVYNQEMTFKELRLSEGQKKLNEENEKVFKAHEKLKNIQISLENSKTEIKNFYENIVPEFETLYMKIMKIHEDSNEKYMKINDLFIKLTENIEKVKKNNCNEVNEFCPQDKKLEKLKTQTETDDSVNISTIEDLTKELVSKLKHVNNKEKLLERERITYKHKMVALKNAKDKLKKDNEDIGEAREKVKMQLHHLEQGMKVLTNKESELLAIKQELDKRANMVSIRENQLELKALQIKEQGALRGERKASK